MKGKFLLIASIVIIAFSQSTNGRAQWLPINEPFGSGVDITAFGVSGDSVCATTYGGGVFLSTNGGSNWTTINKGLTCLNVKSFEIYGGSYFAGTDSGLFRSTNSGASWIIEDNGLPHYIILSISRINGVLVVGAEQHSAFRCTDNGASWTAADSGMKSITVESFAVIGGKLIAGTNGYGVYRSTDEGISWASSKRGFTALSADALTVLDGILYAGSFSGVFRSTDSGESWTSTNNGLNNPSEIALESSGRNIFAGTEGGVFLSTDSGQSWKSVSPNWNVTALAVSDGSLFAGIYYNLMTRPLSQMIGSSAVETIPKYDFTITCYPDPLSQSTTITFSSPETGVAEVTVLNLIGEEVARIFSGEVQCGEHSFSWDASGVALGVYECIVRVNGHLDRLQMVLDR